MENSKFLDMKVRCSFGNLYALFELLEQKTPRIFFSFLHFVDKLW